MGVWRQNGLEFQAMEVTYWGEAVLISWVAAWCQEEYPAFNPKPHSSTSNLTHDEKTDIKRMSVCLSFSYLCLSIISYTHLETLQNYLLYLVKDGCIKSQRV